MSSNTFNLSIERDFTTYFNNILEKCGGPSELYFTITTINNDNIRIKYISESPFGKGVVRRFEQVDDPSQIISITPDPSKLNKLKIYTTLTFEGCPTKEPEITEEKEQEFIQEQKFEPVVQYTETEITEPQISTDVLIEEKKEVDEYINPTIIIPSDTTDDEVSFIEEIGMFHQRDIEVWQKEYSDVESIDSISLSLGSYYNEQNIIKNTFTIQLNSTSFLDLIKKYRDTDVNNNPIRSFKISTNNYSPYLELIKQERYDCIPIYPIVVNVPEHFMLNTILEKNKIKRSINYNNLTDINFNDLRLTIENHVRLYKSYLKNKLSYKEYYNLLSNGGSFNDVDTGSLITIKPANEAFSAPDENKINYNYYKLNLSHPTNIFHYSLYNNHPLNLYSLLFGGPDNKNQLIADIDLSHPDIQTTNLPQHRISNYIPVSYQDQYENIQYNDKKQTRQNIKSCNGTGATDKEYSEDNKESIFFKSIIKAPLEVNLTNTGGDLIKYPIYKGENVVLIGFYIPSLEHIKSFKSNQELRNDEQNMKKYEKVYNNKTNNISIKNGLIDEDKLEIINNINNFSWDNVDPENNYIVFFNNDEKKELDKLEFQHILEKILPNIQNVIKQQKNRLEHCINLLETQEILAEYNIPLNNLNIDIINSMNLKNNFQNNVDMIKKKCIDQRDKLKLLKKYMNSIQSIYHELLLLKWKKQSTDIRISIIQLLNTHTKLELFMFINYYVQDHIKCMNLYEFQEIKNEDMIETITNWFIENTPNIEDLSEFYKWFSTQSLDVDDELIRKLFDDYRVLFSLDKLLDFKTNGTGQYDQYYLRELQMVWNLNHNYNGGRHLLEIFQLIQVIKHQKFINSTIEAYAKEEFNNEIGGDWDSLSDEEKTTFAPSTYMIEKLEQIMNDIYQNYENERKKYNTYNVCDKYRIVKIYSSLDNMYRDNKKTIYYDTRFDTTAFDVRQFKDYQKNHCNQMTIEECKSKFRQVLSRYYLFDNETELNKKVDNVIANIQNNSLKNRRPVSDFEVCIVMIANKKEYFQRMNNFWVPLKEKIEPVQIINTDILPLNFKEVALRLNQTLYRQKNGVDGDECIEIDEMNKLPKQLKENYILYITSNNKVKAFRKILEFKKQVDDDKIRLTEKLQDDYNHLAFLLKKPTISTSSYEEITSDIDTSIYPPDYIQNSLNNILRIDDKDTMYVNLKSFIEEYGTDYNINLSNKLKEDITLNDSTDEEDIKTITIKENKNKYLASSPFHDIQLKAETATYYFYKDIFKDVNVPIICKHHEKLLETPLTSNENRQKLLDYVVNIWGITSGENHICRNCGEVIRARNFSIMEGFDKDDRTMMFREKVIDDIELYTFEDDEVEAETSISDELVDTIKDVQKKAFNDIVRIFKAYQNVLGVKLTYEDTKLALEWTLSLNENDYITRIRTVSSTLEKVDKYKKNIVIYRTIYNYIMFLERLVASVIHILNTSNYIIYGTGTEREVKTGYVIQNIGDVKTAIEYYVNKLLLIIKSDSKYQLYKNTNLIIRDDKIYTKPDITLETNAINQYINKVYDEIGQYGSLAERKELFEKNKNDKMIQRNNLKKYDLWNTFAPPLKYGKQIEDADTFSNISSSIRLSNQLLYKYHDIIKNYQDTISRRNNDTNIRYMSFIMFDNIQSNYLESMIKNTSDIGSLYDRLKDIYYSTMLFISDDKQRVQYIKSNIKARDLQDYMTVSKALLVDEPVEKHEEILRNNLVQKWILFNTIIHLETDINGAIKGKRRVYRELKDDDYELLSGLYSSGKISDYYDADIQSYLYDELKKKYRNYPDDLIDFKIKVIMRMNTEVSPDIKDINKVTTTYDIISNEFRQDIIKKASDRITQLSTDEIEILLLENEKYSVENMGYIISFKNENEINEYEKVYSRIDAESIYINDGLKEILNILNISNIDQETFFNQIRQVQETLVNDNSIIESSLRGIYSSIVTKKITELVTKLSDGNTDIKKVLSSMGTINNYYIEMKNTLYETLKIEGFINEDVTIDESLFRLNIYNNVKNNIELRNLIKICEIELSYAHLYHQINPESLLDFNFEGYQKVLSNIVALENLYSKNNDIARISIINPYCISLLLQTMCLIILDRLKEEELGEVKLFYNELIRHIVTIYVYTNRSNETSYNIIKSLRNDENEKRKNRFNKLRPDEKALYKASRLFGTGKIIGTSLGEIMTEQEALVNDLINSQVDKNARKDEADDLDEGYAYDQDANDEYGDD
jgi:hypothetical protein